MRALLTIFLLLGIAVAMPLLGSVTGVEQRTLDEIYQAALKEPGTLKVAWGGDSTLNSPRFFFDCPMSDYALIVQTIGDEISQAFTKRFPGIELDLTVDLSKYLDSRINRQFQVTNGGEELADVAVLQTLQNFARWKSEGRLMHYKVADWNDIYPEFVDRDGAYTGYNICKIYSLSLLHVTQLLSLKLPSETLFTTLCICIPLSPQPTPSFLIPTCKGKYPSHIPTTMTLSSICSLS